MKVLRFILNLEPFANLETRATKAGHMFTPAAKKEFMNKAAREMDFYSGAFKDIKFINAHFVFVCDRPDKHPTAIPVDVWRKQVNLYKATRPDSDNYCKPLQDSMSWHVISRVKNKHGHVTKEITGAGIIDDDSCICRVTIDKIYRRIDQKPHVLIILKEITNPIYEYPDLSSFYYNGDKSAIIPTQRHTVSGCDLLL